MRGRARRRGGGRGGRARCPRPGRTAARDAQRAAAGAGRCSCRCSPRWGDRRLLVARGRPGRPGARPARPWRRCCAAPTVAAPPAGALRRGFSALGMRFAAARPRAHARHRRGARGVRRRGAADAGRWPRCSSGCATTRARSASATSSRRAIARGPRRRGAGSCRAWPRPRRATWRTRPTRSRWASRSGSSPTPATTRASRTRRWPRGGALRGRGRGRGGRRAWRERARPAPGVDAGRAVARRAARLRFRVVGTGARARERRPRGLRAPGRLLAARPGARPRRSSSGCRAGADPAAVARRLAPSARSRSRWSAAQTTTQRRPPRRAGRLLRVRRPRGRPRVPLRAGPGAGS